MKPTLLVLAAGMGSRYGSLKQMDGMGPCGEAIIDYSIYDAIRAGFGKVVFVIRHSFGDEFKEVFCKRRFGGKINVEYVYQELEYLPEGFIVPDGRQKPWGTNHAVMMGKDVIKEPFAVINADDFYGKESYQVMGDYLRSVYGKKGQYSMVGFHLQNTLSEFGSVSRGICTIDSNNYLLGVVERTSIERRGEHIVYFENNVDYKLEPECYVSMNFWGFTPDYFEYSDKIFKTFLKNNLTNYKAEFYIPYCVDVLIKEKNAKLKILNSDSKWFGITYKEDRPFVVDKINKLIAAGVYPKDLWG